ncbi:unnamed protein product [Mycena citricolor]|uniref:ubiquitinyl hydrolase 1 n=1 Tax=Mycena citricolor TaxID=2018698 RepID=A0AAD2H2D9_9AGAR|nr:unnamed protein product [Mycena citricolor]
MLSGPSAPPTSPGLGGFGAPRRSNNGTQNGIARHLDSMTAAQIKTHSIEVVKRETKGAAPLSLLRMAGTQIASATECENKGDLRNALAAFTKCATLVQTVMDSTEFKKEGVHGVVHKEARDFLERNPIQYISSHMTAAEEKLKAIEKEKEKSEETTGPVSIQDRIQALKNNGLQALGDVPRRGQPAGKPPAPATALKALSGLESPISLNMNALSLSTPSAPPSTSSSPHALVSPHSFGPPSPTSTPSSSPLQPLIHTLPSVPHGPAAPLRTFSISSTEAKFPSISELDETFALPSVNTGISTGSGSTGSGTREQLTTLADTAASSSSSPSFRNYLPIERPSSTPVTPSLPAFVSRPPSPSRPPIPVKPSALSSAIPKPALPNSGSAFPKDLYAYLRDHKVLLLDVRNRADFEKVHIKTDAIVCVEPVVLSRAGLTADRLEDSMASAPTNETTMFKNRDKFDLIVVYDQSSQSLGPPSAPMAILVRLISEQAFTKMLKRMPMVLIGGLDAWRRDIGDNEVTSSTLSTLSRTTSTNGEGAFAAPSPVTFSSSSSIANGFSSTNGVSGYVSSATVNGYSGSATMTTSASEHQLWTPRSRADTNPIPTPSPTHLGHRPNFSVDQSIGHSRSPAEISCPTSVRKPPLRPTPSGGPFGTIPESTFSGTSSPIAYPSFSSRNSPSVSSPPPIMSPPQASINPTLSRRRSDYIDQSQEAVSSLRPLDYPSQQHLIRPPPAVASSALERQERPRGTTLSNPPSSDVPRINSDYAPTYWSDISIGTSGLKNLGNTCYMNAPIQCLSASLPFAQFFANGRWKTAVNTVNPHGSKGLLSGSFANLVRSMWSGELPYIIPVEFRKTVCHLNSQYNGSNQHDSQEFLSFLLDGIHEDLNRLLIQPTFTRTPEQEAELERLSPQIASEQEWRLWKTRNDSLIVDFFQGQFRNRLQCSTCSTTSTTYNVFSILQLPIPTGRGSKVPLQSCIDAFFNREIMDKDDAWDCPKCKTKRRATKELSLARLPPILVIHLKRFEIHGRFSDKIDTFVDYPVKSLDLTNFMPPPLPPGADKSQLNGGMPMSSDDPRVQLPPYKYNLYAVTNHTGNLTSGHYTAFIADRDGWKSCDDSSIRSVDEKQVVNQRAYVLFYKRVKNTP